MCFMIINVLYCKQSQHGVDSEVQCVWRVLLPVLSCGV